MAAKGQVEQICTADDAAAGGVAHSVECPQVDVYSLSGLLAWNRSTALQLGGVTRHCDASIATISVGGQEWYLA